MTTREEDWKVKLSYYCWYDDELLKQEMIEFTEKLLQEAKIEAYNEWFQEWAEAAHLKKTGIIMF